MSFVSESEDFEPNIEEGDVVTAEVQEIEAPKESKFGKQVEFSVELESGYETKVWISWYDEEDIHDGTHLGKLCNVVMRRVGEEFETIDETLDALESEIGSIFVKCNGFSEAEGTRYPNLNLIPDKLPTAEEESEAGEEKKSQRFCPHCGEEISSDSRFCPECGEKL